MSVETLRAPFPWFGSKRGIADQVWQAFGDVDCYTEPFAGSIAVLLARPGGAHGLETVNDLDGHLCNFWRSIQAHPEEVARAADYPVIEIDLHSRHKHLNDRTDELAQALGDDPRYCDPLLAGWWAWGLSAWIGSGWCPGAGRVAREQVPHLTNHGGGMHGLKLSQRVPHLSDNGVGVHSLGLSTKVPRLSDAVGVQGVTIVKAGLAHYCERLSERLRRVRVMCGDWRRVVTPSAIGFSGGCGCGNTPAVFLDPPYAANADGKRRRMGLYGDRDCGDVASAAREWARQAAIEHPSMQIILCGYEGEHEDLEGWRVVEWDTADGGFGAGGYGRQANGAGRENAGRERLYLSPACKLPTKREQLSLV